MLGLKLQIVIKIKFLEYLNNGAKMFASWVENVMNNSTLTLIKKLKKFY